MNFYRLALLLGLIFCFGRPALAQADPAREHFNRGVALQQQGDLTGARQAYEQALKLSPRRVDALANLGLVHLSLGQNEQAVERFTKALTLQTDLVQVRMYLGFALFRAGRIDAAQAELMRVLDARPDDPQARHLLGLCLLKRDRIEEGIQALASALAANPGNVDAAYTLATAYLGVGDIEKAEGLLSGPLRQNNTAESHLIRGMLLNARKEAKAALAELTEAKRLNDKLPMLRTQVGYAWLLLAEHDSAAAEFLAELKQSPDDFHANAYLGWLYIQQKRYPEAMDRLAAGLRKKPANATLLYQLGHLHYIGGQMNKSARLLEDAVRLRPDFIPAHVLLARAYSKLKRPEDFKREQDLVRRLTEKEQERNLVSEDGYVEQENTLTRFTDGVSGKPATAKKEH